jgi:pyroglutamyl-peptidase
MIFEFLAGWPNSVGPLCKANMTTTVLLTGFGPFPGAPVNPTEPLVLELAQRRHPGAAEVRRLAHVFRVSYQTVDRELPELIERERPDAIVMFGLAARSRLMRIETLARNVLSCSIPDAVGRFPDATTIAAEAPVTLAMPAPVERLLTAARSTGVPIRRSRDAGGYLCNYLCWRAAEAAHTGRPQLATFVHVPPVRPATRSARTALTFDDLLRAGEAIVRAATEAVR